MGRSTDGFIAPENQTEAFWMTSAESKKIVTNGALKKWGF